jgi:hypothetical protein
MDKGPPELLAKPDEELQSEINELTAKRKELVRQLWNLDSDLVARKEILYQRRIKRGYSSK